MAIVGFSFTKIRAEKTAAINGQVSVNNNVSLVDVRDADLGMGPSKKGVRVRFAYKSTYEPALGFLELEGDVVLLEDAKFAEEILANWTKEKALPRAVMSGLLNHVLERSNIQALILSRDIGLPAPIPMPKVNVQAASEVQQKPEEKKPAKAKK